MTTSAKSEQRVSSEDECEVDTTSDKTRRRVSIKSSQQVSIKAWRRVSSQVKSLCDYKIYIYEIADAVVVGTTALSSCQQLDLLERLRGTNIVAQKRTFTRLPLLFHS